MTMLIVFGLLTLAKLIIDFRLYRLCKEMLS